MRRQIAKSCYVVPLSWLLLLLLVIVAGGVANVAAAPLDHFLCYTVRTTRGTPRFEPIRGLALADQFEEGNFDVRKPEVLCVPAQKNGEVVLNPDIHLKGYDIKRSKGSPKHIPKTNINVVNQFGGITIDTRAPDRLLVPSLKSLQSDPGEPDPATHNVDHFKCYTVKLSKGAQKFPKGLRKFVVDQFDQGKVYEITKPTRLCVPVDKAGEEIKKPQNELMCYAVKRAKGEPKHTKITRIHVNNQFGPEVLDTVKEGELCVPPPNHPPDAVDDSATTTANTPINVNVLINDTDPDGDTLTVTSFTQGTSGKVSCTSAGVCTYTPNQNFDGTDSFTYTVSDGLATDTATVRVSVNPAPGCPAPSITSVDPLSGPVGTEVTIRGTNLDCGATRSLSFNGVPGVITFLSSTLIKTFIPIGGQDGLFSYTTEGGTVTAPQEFSYDVVLSNDFSVTVAPAEGKVVQGSSSSYSIEVKTLGGQPFTGLAKLELTGLPSGVTCSLSPSTLTGGQRGTLTCTADPTAPLGSSTLTLHATASIDAQTVTKTTGFDLTVLQGGRSVLLGQFMLKDGPPMPGVKLALVSHVDGSILAQTETDGAGNFQFLDPPAGAHTLSVDTTPVNPSFPIYGVDVTLIAGETLVLPPFMITPPPPPERFTPIQNKTQDQVVSDPRFPGVSILLRAGVTVTGWDGKVKEKIAIMKFSPDELPMPPPPGPTRSLYQFHFGTNMGGLPSAPLPVTIPNDQGLSPGEKAEIWYYDAAPFVGVPGAWRMAGLGTVSADGSVIVSDPGVGITRFCGVCGTTCIINRGQTQQNNNPGSPGGGDPVNLALGQMIEEKTDLVLPGRIPAVIHRTYNPFDPFGAIAGFELGLGPGWALSVEVVLLEVNASLRRMILPGNARFDFTQQGMGSFVNTTHPRFAGAVLTAEAGGRHRLRFKDGTVWRFAQSFLAGTSLLVEQADRNGNRLTIERNPEGKVTGLIEPAGRALTFTYTGNRITEIGDPTGRKVQYGYNGGRLETITNPGGGVTRYTYNAQGRILTITDPRLITYLTNEYDANGRVFRQTQADGGVWLFQYLGPPGATTGVIMTDPRGNKTPHKFNPTGFASETIDALGQITRFERDEKGQVTSTIDLLGRVTRFEYDGAGNVTKIIDPAGNIRLSEYEPNLNKLTKLTDPLGKVTAFTYDNRGNLIRITDPLGNITQIAYNQFGQPISMTDPLKNVTAFTYDVDGNLLMMRDPFGNTSRRTYDPVSRLIGQTDARGRTTNFTYDELNRVKQIEDALKGPTAFTYDANGNLITVTDARGNQITHTYDVMDRLQTRTDPVGAVESFQYDSLGNFIRYTDRKGQINTFSYDPVNRRTGANYADGAKTAFSYDSVGRLVQAADSVGGTILNAFDNLDRLIAHTTDLGAIQYTYDALGRRKSMTVTGQSTVSYSYDANSRLVQIVQGAQVVDFEYDAIGRQTRLILPNNVSTDYIYDSASRITELVYSNATSVLGNLTYQYDTTGHRTGVGGSFARSLLPDPLSSAQYDAGNRQLSFGPKTMTFDRNGNLETIADPAGPTTFTWDSRNRLIGVSGPNLAATFSYDPISRRAHKTVNGQSVAFQYDEDDAVHETRGSGGVGNLRSLLVDELLGQGGQTFPLRDALGNTIALTDGEGQIVASYTYDPYGRVSVTGEDTTAYQYTGREADAEGLYYYRARYYNPVLARFLQEDPIGLRGGGLNFYVYVGNDPVNFIDPLGLDFGDYWDIRATVNFYDQVGSDPTAGWATKGGAKLGSWLLKNFGMLAAQQAGEAFGSGHYWCGVLRGVQSLSQASSLAFAPSGLKNVGQWIKNPFWYEIGSKTVPTAVFELVKHLPPAERGKAIVKVMGWWGVLFKFSGSWGKTLAQGPTPGGLLGLYGVGQGLGAFGGAIGCK